MPASDPLPNREGCRLSPAHRPPAAAGETADHVRRVVEQFTQQAVPFSNAAAMRDRAAIERLVGATDPRPNQRSLDVACGPGLVVLAYAPRVEHAVGLDATPAMLGRAEELRHAAGCANVGWVRGVAAELPFDDGSFDIVTCRFAVHHLQDPAAAVAEMRRVCKPGGRVAICDAVAPDEPMKAARFDRMERLRDPSTVRFLGEAELLGLMAAADLSPLSLERYRVEVEMAGLLRASFPAPEAMEELETLLRTSVVDDALGMGAFVRDGRTHLHYRAVIAVCRKG